MFWKKTTPKFIEDVLRAVSEKEEKIRAEKFDSKRKKMQEFKRVSSPLFDILQGSWMHLPIEIFGLEEEKIKIVSRKPESYGKSIMIHLFWTGKNIDYAVYRMSTNANESLDWTLVDNHKDVQSLIKKLPNYLADWVLT